MRAERKPQTDSAPPSRPKHRSCPAHTGRDGGRLDGGRHWRSRQWAGAALTAPEWSSRHSVMKLRLSLLDPLVFGLTEKVGVLRHQREDGLAFVFGNSRGSEHLGRWHG